MNDVMQRAPIAASRALATLPDETLLVRYRDAHDLEAFEELARRWSKPLRAFLTRYLHDAELADEALQGTFLRVHEGCSQFTEGRRFQPWLYSVATHQAIDALRRERRHRLVSLDEEHETGEIRGALADTVVQADASPALKAERHEMAEWARGAIDALPERLREPMRMIYFQGLSHREAAERLRLPIGTLKTRVHHGLLALREAWTKQAA